MRQLRGDRTLNVNNFNIVNQGQYDEYFKFTFVRNPWSRAFSWYANVLRDDTHRKAKGIKPDIGFQEFLVRAIGKGNLRPQTFWIKDLDGKVSLDFIGRYESLAEDFARIASRLGVERELPHELRGEGIDYRSMYNAESKDLIWNCYKEEIELFDYEFEA